MACYVIAEVEVTDAAAFEEYRQRVPATIAKHGGKYLVRGGAAEAIEGDWKPTRLVVLEFASLARARAWYASPDYAPLIPLRERSARTKLIFAEGIEANGSEAQR
jgi:uncharacterized protein (DUF1330 family)